MRKNPVFKRLSLGIATLILPCVSFAGQDMISEAFQNLYDIFMDDWVKWIIAGGMVVMLVLFMMGHLSKSKLYIFLITAGGLLSIPYIMQNLFSLSVS